MDNQIAFTNLTIEQNKTHWLILRVIASISILIALINLTIRAGTNGLDQDEIEHTHVAWLMFNGQVPFQDFFQMHPLTFYYLLVFYYQVFGENITIFFWGRGLMVVCFIFSIWLIYLLGKEMFGTLGGLIASLIFCLNRLAQSIAVFIRADGLMLVCLLAGLYVFLKSWYKDFRPYQAILAGLLLGIAFSIHPRSGFAVLGLAVSILVSRSSVKGIKQIWERKIELVLFTVFSFLPILTPFFIYGFQAYFEKIYVIGFSVVTSYSPWDQLWEVFTQSFGIFPLVFVSIGVYLFTIIKDREKTSKCTTSLWLVLINFLGIVLIPLTNELKGIGNARGVMAIQNFYSFTAFLALFVTGSFIWIIGQLSLEKKLVVLYLFMILALASTLRPQNWYFSWQGLKANLAKLENIKQVIPSNESYVGPIMTNPVFCKNGTYYWHDEIALEKTRNPNFKHDFIAEFEKTKPFLVNKQFIEFIHFDPQEQQRVKEYLEQNYYSPKQLPGFLIRK